MLIFFWRFGSSYWSPTPPPAPPWIAIYFDPDRNIFCVSDVFKRHTAWSSEDEGGGVVFQTDDVGQGGIQKVFARTSLMDEP